MAKKSRKTKGPKWIATGRPVEAPAPLDAEEVAAAVADGQLIARFSAVLALKNRLIVAALRDDQDFAPESAARMAREVLGALAAEQDENVVHANEIMHDVEDSWGSAQHEHDYKARDLERLTARRTVYREVAARIREVASDPDALAALIEDARRGAWAEISREIESRLQTVRAVAGVVVDEEYRRDRAERMRRVREFDLWELAEGARSRP